MNRYGNVSFKTIQDTKNELRRAIQSEGTERIQELWDRLEQWIDSPPMMPQPYMGQIIAECDCPRETECNLAGKCLAEERKQGHEIAPFSRRMLDIFIGRSRRG